MAFEHSCNRKNLLCALGQEYGYPLSGTDIRLFQPLRKRFNQCPKLLIAESNSFRLYERRRPGRGQGVVRDRAKRRTRIGMHG
jgi:hypothetical protein